LHQTDFLAELLPILKKKGLDIFVQTAGSPFTDFARLLPLVNRWCIDLKCKVDRHTSRNRKILEKITEQTTPESTYFRLAIDADDDPEKVLQLIKGIPLDDYTLILQPCAIFPAHISDWDTGTIIDWIQVFKPYFFQVRWIPQVHKLLPIQ
jgi:organic radical activating enzyme